MVRYSYLNLIEDQYPSLTNGTNNVDLVLCNNVLIYFSEQQSRRVIAQLDKSLVDGGHLCVTPIEAAYVDTPSLELETDIGCNIFRSNKNSITSRNKIRPNLLNNLSRDLQKKSANIRKKSVFFEKFLKQTPEIAEAPLEEQVIKASSESCKAIYSRMSELYQSGEYHKVIEELETYLSEQKCDVTEYLSLIKLLIKSLVNTGKLEQAKYWCEKSLSEDMTNPTLHYLHAAIFQEFNCMEEAIASLKKAIFLDGNFSIAYFTMGNILLTQDDFFEARKHFRNVVITLDKLDDETVVPEAEELTSGRLKEIVEHILTRL